MMKSTVAVLLLILAGIAAGPAEAAKFECPGTLGVTETVHPEREKDWQPMTVSGGNGESHGFRDIYFTYGPPSQLADIDVAREIRNRKQRVKLYNFQLSDGFPVWIACEYSRTTIVLAQPVTGPHRQCRVTYEPLTGFAIPKEVECH